MAQLAEKNATVSSEQPVDTENVTIDKDSSTEEGEIGCEKNVSAT